MKNERVDKLRHLWSQAKLLEERSESLPDVAAEANDHKCRVADFIVPILFDEVEYYQTTLAKLISLWDQAYKLERRIDIKNAMDVFDAQFSEITEKIVQAENAAIAH